MLPRRCGPGALMGSATETGGLLNNEKRQAPSTSANPTPPRAQPRNCAAPLRAATPFSLRSPWLQRPCDLERGEA